ncbi:MULTISPECIES: YhgE/Pip family protein [unclassified Microbacterium]|uniref:YhgE/Pip family protein n=1 Tax=unclassified Microbacterium TaxID=2609290 RepID=UPI000EAA888E|nr:MULTISPECIES: YhgE/Pip family protein [unclassified Microbacterium]MBT2484130.1 YhgE/Pip family protein [Microbacterium sp. ISL-108]RKN67077.1 YhgE/Pip domain-containing protein [Microbacterium sp. CGR2]
MKVPSMIAAELRRLTASKMGFIALVALVCVPILYGGLYLWANQDPYANFPDVPVALVVDDEGAPNPSASAEPATVNYGEDVAENLIEGNAFDWQRMTDDGAADALRDGAVDFTVTIPSDFSSALTSASGDEPQQARIELATNDANNYLASSMGTQAVEKIRSSVAEMVGSEAAERLLTGLSDVRDKLSTATDGATQLTDGANSAVSGSSTLADGTTQLADGTSKLAAGAQTLADGAQQVSDGNRQLADVADRAGSAVQQATDALPEARTDITTALAEQGLTDEQITQVLARLDPVSARLQDGNTQVQGAVDKVDALAAGAAAVASGAADLASGADTVATGAAAAESGAAQLRDGLGTLASGTTELRDGLADGVEAIPASTPDLRSLQADTIADPVAVSSDKVASAEDYGAGLAPFFAALSAWIGIYALFLIVKPISRRAITALHSPIRITLAGWLTPAALGAVQMLGLMGVLAITLGFTFDNPLGTLGIMMFASATFAGIILALNVWLGSVGQFLGLVLMVLQLVTAGGTFPWQTLPAPLAALHHVLPLGYVVDAMRQLMYGGDLARAGGDLVVLGIWLIGALIFAMIGVTRMTHRRTLRDLQPSLIG